MKGKMKAMVFYEPLKMKYEEVDIPQIGPDEVLVKVKACGICGSDIAYYWGLSPLETADGKGPLILGHEYSGEIVEMGDIPKTLGLFEVGDRVAVDPLQYCNACESCKKGQVNLCENKLGTGVSIDGGFAEYVRTKYTCLFTLPDSVSYEQAAFAEPLADAFYAIQNMEINLGDFCVVFFKYFRRSASLVFPYFFRYLIASSIMSTNVFPRALSARSKVHFEFI